MSVGLRNQYLITLNWSPIFCTLSSVGFWLLDIQKLTWEEEHLWKWAALTILPLWCKSCKSLLMMFIECSFLPGSHSTKGFKIIQRKYRHFVCVCVSHSVVSNSLQPHGLWRRQWHPTPVLLPGKYHGQRSLVGCSPWGSQRVRHDWATSLSLFTFLHWRRKWQPTPLFLPGESQGWRSLVGCRVWGRTESDITEVT